MQRSAPRARARRHARLIRFERWKDARRPQRPPNKLPRPPRAPRPRTPPAELRLARVLELAAQAQWMPDGDQPAVTSAEAPADAGGVRRRRPRTAGGEALGVLTKCRLTRCGDGSSLRGALARAMKRVRAEIGRRRPGTTSKSAPVATSPDRFGDHRAGPRRRLTLVLTTGGAAGKPRDAEATGRPAQLRSCERRAPSWRESIEARSPLSPRSTW